jgi:transposase
VRYLAPGHGKTKQGYLWAMHRPGSDTVFHWHTGRSAACLRTILPACLRTILPAGWRGILQCDGYAAYDAHARECQGTLTLASCMAHIRRGFYEAKEEAPQRAGWVLRQIAHLYALEKKLRESNAGPALRQAQRAATAALILTRLKKALHFFKSSRRHLPQSALGKAINYALGQWDALAPYLTDGRVEIVNNQIENAIRPTAVGKKNYLFFGDAAAGETSAILYTVIESARRRGLNPQEYLRDILTGLPAMNQRDIGTITPCA